jgi:membrane-associated protein
MILDILTSLDKNLIWIIQTYGLWTYPLLFVVIFLETGLVVTPFLPGDSLLFSAGALASRGLINVFLIFLIAAFAAIIGDTVNYWIGRFIGEKVSKSRFVKEEYLIRTQKFYDKYGTKTIILARFVPIIRTFAPFVAGIGKMKYSKFFAFNIIGGILWTSLLTFAGFFFGNISFVKNNLSTVILAIVFISFLPIIIELIKSKVKKKKEISV